MQACSYHHCAAGRTAIQPLWDRTAVSACEPGAPWDRAMPGPPAPLTRSRRPADKHYERDSAAPTPGILWFAKKMHRKGFRLFWTESSPTRASTRVQGDSTTATVFHAAPVARP